MAFQTHHTSATAVQGSQSSLLTIVYGVGPVVAGLLAVAVFIDGLMSMGQNPAARLWVLAGLVAYLLAWGWGLKLAQS